MLRRHESVLFGSNHLCEGYLRHTDHKETRHALPTWWGLVAKADGIGTGNLIAQQMLDTPNHQAEAIAGGAIQTAYRAGWEDEPARSIRKSAQSWLSVHLW